MEGISFFSYTTMAFLDIVSAVSHLHKNGIMHRYLKPENILLDADGHALLTDFGLAKQFEENKVKVLMWNDRIYIYIYIYMPPEFILGKDHDKAADWWIIGILLFEMLTGKDERNVFPPSTEAMTAAIVTGVAFAVGYGIEIAIEFKPLEHPTEPLDNDRPIQCPLTEPSIHNVWKRFIQFKQTYGDLASMLKVEQRWKEALCRIGEEGASALESSLQDVVSRYSFMDLWPCSSKDLDNLVWQEALQSDSS